MVELSLDPREFATVKEVPISTSVAVVTPMGKGWHVADDAIEGYQSLVVLAKVLTPPVHFLLASGIPRHFAAEWEFLGNPFVG